MQIPAFHQAAADVLTPHVATILLAGNQQPAGSAYTRLVTSGPGHSAAKMMLDALDPALLLRLPIHRVDEARCLVAGLWLWHDWLDESHTISQAVETPSGSFWHAIMHRREGDFFNAKYWNARCRHHPARDALGERAGPVIAAAGDDAERWGKRLTRGGWDADAFVDLAEFAHAHPHDHAFPLAVALQRLEWQVLFEHCAHVAVGE